MNITDNSIIPVILSGGSGTRLWPLSRESYPKQFLALDSRTKKTLLQKTYERLLGLDGLENPILICNEDHRFIVAEQFREINTDPQAIILEPVGRNTAPAIAVCEQRGRCTSYHTMLVSKQQELQGKASAVLQYSTMDQVTSMILRSWRWKKITLKRIKALNQ